MLLQHHHIRARRRLGLEDILQIAHADFVHIGRGLQHLHDNGGVDEAVEDLDREAVRVVRGRRVRAAVVRARRRVARHRRELRAGVRH